MVGLNGVLNGLVVAFAVGLAAVAHAQVVGGPTDVYKTALARSVAESQTTFQQIRSLTHSSCRGLKSRLACAEKVQSLNAPRFTTDFVNQSVVLTAVILADIEANGKRGQVSEELKLVEALLRLMEGFSTRNFLVNSLTARNSSESIEIAQLKSMESELLAKGRTKLLSILQEKMTSIHGKLTSGRAPAGAAAVENIRLFNSLNQRYEALRQRPADRI